MKKILMALYLALPMWAQAGFVMEEGVRPQPKKEQLVSKDAAAPAKEAAPPPKAPTIPAPPVVKGVALTSVLYTGAPDKEPEVLQGFGEDVKLADAIRRIAPADWHVFWREETTRRGVKDFRVKWSDGRSWIEHLNRFGSDLGLVFEVDWERKHIFVSDKKTVADKAGPSGVSPGPVLWTVKPGAFLHATLLEWTAKAGWSLVWGLSDQDDFRLEAGNNNSPGEFKAAVYELIDSLPPNVRIRVELVPDNAPPLLYVTRDEGVRQ